MQQRAIHIVARRSVGILAILCCGTLAAAEPAAEEVEFFEKKVRPILAEACQKCHGAFKQEGGLRLDSREALFKGGDTGLAITAGKPEESLLVEAIGYAGDIKMPPKGKLPAEQIAALTEWVKRGAVWPADKTPPGGKPGEFDLAARKAKQWVYQPIRPAAPPAVKNQAWPQNAIDNFILAMLESVELAPAMPVDKRTLLRRATFDLIGLPPTPAEIDAFLADESPRAFERVVERLLDSPHYGERWGRHWLDLVRFAETHGHEFDFEIPNAFEYRDYVIRALNADVPYNQFVIEHIAGDLLPQPRRHPTAKFNESIIGTGFWYLGEATHSPVDVRSDEATRIDNQIDVFGKAFLAETLACARCHDHKFDAISTNDYYALSGYLHSSRYAVTCVDQPDERQATVKNLAALQRKETSRARLFAAENATKSSARVSRSLLATLAVLRPDPEAAADPIEKRLASASEKFGISTTDLSNWITYIKETALKNVADPFHLWARLAQRPGAVTAGDVATLIREQTASVQAAIERSRGESERLTVFENFAKPGFADWFVEGEAFGQGPARLPTGIPGGSFFSAVQGRVGDQAAHSGVISNRLEGVLRSRTFTIDKNRMLYHAAGTGARINLIVDSYQLIRYPIYGGLTITLDSPDRYQWHVQDVSKWVGHSAYIELIDSGDGFISVDQILCGDGDRPTETVNSVSQLVLADGALDSQDQVARSYERLIARVLGNWRSENQQESAGSDRPAADAILDWYVSSNLAGSLPHALAASTGEIRQQIAGAKESKQKLESAIRYERKALTMIDGSPEDDRVHLRGSPHKFGDIVPRRGPEALEGDTHPAPTNGSGRLELARRLVEPANPVVPRVIVNRLWKYHFGTGLVQTPDDFGNMGQPPTHPELLDYLATEFVKRGWSLKQMHRLLMLSQTYQMSSREGDTRSAGIDPQNRLWHRMNLHRLEAETIRDAMLAVSGRLDRQILGHSVPAYLTPFMIGRGRPAASGPLDGAGRRSVYLSVRRNFLTPMLLAFDYPIPFSTIGKRSVSNVPAQALALMNNPFVLEQATVWANKVGAESADPAERIRRMYVTAFGRPPTEAEVHEATDFIVRQAQQYAATDSSRPWADLAHVLFNVKEFIFIE